MVQKRRPPLTFAVFTCCLMIRMRCAAPRMRRVAGHFATSCASAGSKARLARKIVTRFLTVIRVSRHHHRDDTETDHRRRKKLPDLSSSSSTFRCRRSPSPFHHCVPGLSRYLHSHLLFTNTNTTCEIYSKLQRELQQVMRRRCSLQIMTPTPASLQFLQCHPTPTSSWAQFNTSI